MFGFLVRTRTGAGFLILHLFSKLFYKTQWVDAQCFLLRHDSKAQCKLITCAYSPRTFFPGIQKPPGCCRKKKHFSWLLAEVLRQFTSTQEIFSDRHIHIRNLLGTGMNFKWFNSLWFSLRKVMYFFLNVIFLTAMHSTWLEDLRPGWRWACPVDTLVALFIHKKVWLFWTDLTRSYHLWGYSLRVGFMVSGSLASWFLRLHLEAGTTF